MILIVDDHPDTCEMLKRVLARRGMESTACQSGTAALSLLYQNSQKPKVVVLDEMMPDKTGLEVFRQLKADPSLKDINVIFYSAGFDYSKHQEALRLGAKAWFVKGVNRLDDLVRTISTCTGPA